jgi:hypothetical protein
MKKTFPIKKTILVELDVWDCGDSSHKHKKEEAALRCYEKRVNRKPSIPKNTKRAIYLRAARAILNGESYDDVAGWAGFKADTIKRNFLRILRATLSPKYSPGKIPCYPLSYNLDEIRETKQYWLKQLTKLDDSQLAMKSNNHE